MGRWPLLAASLVAGACSFDADAPEIVMLSQPVVFGEDDRQDLSVAQEPFVRLGRDNAIALIGPDQLELGEDGTYEIRAPSYG